MPRGPTRGADGNADPSELFRLWPPPMSERKTDDLDRWWWRGDAVSKAASCCEPTDAGKEYVMSMLAREDMAEFFDEEKKIIH